MPDTIIVLDYGSQTTQLIARRIREVNVYCELLPWDTPAEEVLSFKPKGFILSGSPNSIYETGAPQVPDYVLNANLPIFGICYGMQGITQALGGIVSASTDREFGQAWVDTTLPNPLLPSERFQAWMSHGDRIEKMPDGFVSLAVSPNSPIAAMADLERQIYGVQFHPEVHHTPRGHEMIRHFVIDICGAEQTWTTQSMITHAVKTIRETVGDKSVLAAVSGGVDSTVAAALLHIAIGSQLTAVFVDHGLLRAGEREQVEKAFRKNMGAELVVVDEADTFLDKLTSVTDPEQKRRIIGETFIRIFEQSARELGMPEFLMQGTIYPDVVESRAAERSNAAHIKTHHNVGGLPKDLSFKLVEPLRYMFKDEVRQVGEALGLPEELVWRQPFPGPGLAVRCLGEITRERLKKLRLADKIFTDELAAAGLLYQKVKSDLPVSSQAFAVLLPVQSVGVMGDQRTYQETIALRAVTTEDFMTADWTRLPYDLLARAANRIVNEVDGVNRVVYDITSKPPSTIEWE